MRIATLMVVVLILSCSLFAQQTPALPQTQQKPKQVLSPPGQAEFTFTDGKKIIVNYARPSIRGRKIMGDLVPFGKVWRTGANAATTFETQADIELAGTRIPAGKYTLYTVPDEQSWTIIINKQTGQWGTNYKQDQDLARVTVKPTRLDKPIEQFTISFEPGSGSEGVMKLEWESTSVPVEFKPAA